MSQTITKPMRAGVLNRKSTDAKESRSVEEQNIENLAVCERNGWTVERTYTLRGQSASRFGGNEPLETVLGEPLRDIRARTIDVLVVWETSRASRDVAAFHLLLNACEEAGVLLCSGGRTYDPSDGSDRMILGIDSLNAERHSTDTRKRVMRHQAHAAQEGRPHGRLLYGYSRTYDPNSGALIGQEPDEKAAVVREIVEDYLETSLTGRIADKLNARGEPSPKGAKWGVSQIKRILTNPAYAGLRVYRGEIIGDADWPAIITLAERERILAMLDDPVRHQARQRTGAEYLLTGIALCGTCGDRMYRMVDRNNRNVLACRGTVDPAYPKGHVVRDMSKVDDLVTLTLLNRLAQPDAVEALAADDDTAVSEARTEITVLQQRLDDAANEYLAGNLSAPMLAKIETGLRAQIEAARRKVRPAGIPDSALDLTVAEDLKQAWENLDMGTKREIIRSLMTVTIKPSSLPRGSKRFNPTDIEIGWRY